MRATAQNLPLEDTLFTQPSIFVIEYALARFWQSLGIEPAMMAGHSIGEFVAATIAGVWKLEDALQIIALRGRLDAKPASWLHDGGEQPRRFSRENSPAALQIASDNAPRLCVVSGSKPDVDLFQRRLEAENILCRHLHTSHAFHSAIMDPVVEPLREAVAKVQLRPPARPFVSTVTGVPITDVEATDPSYWAKHARATVLFSKAIQYLKEQGHDLFLECGPRSTLCSLTRQQFSPGYPCTAIPTLADTDENNTEWATLLFALGSLWQNGLSIDWDAFYVNEDRHRLPLPTYPFEKRRFWVDPASVAPTPQRGQAMISSLATNPSCEPEVGPVADVSIGPKVSIISRKDRLASRLVDLIVTVSGLERSQISTLTTFMDQGFDSLSLTQVAYAVRRDFSTKVSFGELMNRFPNVEMLAAHLDATMTAENPAETPAVAASLPIPHSSVAVAHGSAGESMAITLQNASAAISATAATGHLAVETTVPQRGMYASSRLSEHLSASYNESMTLRFTGTISIEKMASAMERLVERHDALRASFDESGLVMKIAPGLSLTMPVVDIASIRDLNEQEERLRRLIAEDTASPFPLPEDRCSEAKWFCSVPIALQSSSQRTTSSAMAGHWMF